MEDAATSTPMNAVPLGIPHAFHSNLPPHHLDEDGVPFVTRFAHKKARQIVQLARSIQLQPHQFVSTTTTAATTTTTTPTDATGDDPMQLVDEEEDDLLDDDDELINAYDDQEGSQEVPSNDNPHAIASPDKETLGGVIKKCIRLQAQLHGLEGLKHNGITQLELCDMVLHLLKLVSATVTYDTTNTTETGVKEAALHYDNVGYLYAKPADNAEFDYATDAKTPAELDDELDQTFALPTPAREVLLTILVNLLSNKGPLRSVSNAALYPAKTTSTGTSISTSTTDRHLLILHWKALLRMLLRTAPYLDERKESKPPLDSNTRQSTVLKRTVQLIRDARHFFDQGIRPPTDGKTATTTTSVVLDKTAREIWDMVQTDVSYHVHSHACYRGTILLYLFHPSRCSSAYYLEMMPLWMQCWTNIDRCPEYDFLWLAMFCRARKHVSPDDYDWGVIRRRLLTHSQYWLQLPIGGVGMDKSFPRAANPRSRSCPPRLKVFAAAGSSYEEGIDFVAKVAKLLVTSLGMGAPEEDTSHADSTRTISSGTNDILRFLNFVTPYFNPSNLGSWTFTLGAFLHYFAYEMCCRIGATAALECLKKTHPELRTALQEAQPGAALRPIPPHEVVALMDAMLPLCQQALYSKNGHVGRAGEAAMLYLVQIDPVHATPSFVDFAMRALDISAVNLSHQAPAALSALTRLIQPALRSDPSILLARLPNLLRLSLAGIDSNDQNKTIRTLILYRNLSSWVPVGGPPESWPSMKADDERPLIGANGTMRFGTSLFDSLAASRSSPEYLRALEQLSPASLLKQGVSIDYGSPEMQRLLLEEASSAMSDWVLEFLDRVFGLLRNSGEREKAGKTASGVASRHSSADVHQARNFSRVLKECLLQVFASMDSKTHSLAVRLVIRFIEEETLSTAAKDASLLCLAVGAARGASDKEGCFRSLGLDALMPMLTDDLPRHSTKTVMYRLRCLAGAVRAASHGVVKHRDAISRAIDFALSSDDRHLFKTGCKLLRHTLATLCESYPVSSDTVPRAFSGESTESILLGKSAQLTGDVVQWHVPNSASIEFACHLFKSHVSKRLDALSERSSKGQSRLLSSLDIQELRGCLRVIRYSIRGGATLLLDYTDEKGGAQNDDCVPYEKANLRLLNTVSDETRVSLLQLRGRLCSFIVVLSSVIATETLYPDSVMELAESNAYRKMLPLICSDGKVCKETSDIALLLLTRRGASFRSQEARTIWKAQKQLATDFTLCAQADYLVESLQKACVYGETNTILYKDGEDAGKTVPRRLLVARVKLFHDSLQRLASFEVPKRLRRESFGSTSPRCVLFDIKDNLSDMMSNVELMLSSAIPRPLDGYEGIVDGLFALCCHSNTQVRASAISVVDYGLTRFGWLVGLRVPRLISAIALDDADMNGKFGIPSCTALIETVDQQGKRKRLAEAVKGVCSILALPRAVKYVLGTEKMRLKFTMLVCGTDRLISLLPPEEMQKMVHYLQSIFSPFRSKLYFQPRPTLAAQNNHEACLKYTLDILSEGSADTNSNESNEGKEVHWRKLLLGCWFLLSTLDGNDVQHTELCARPWTTCFRIIENETGQPLQRVALGLLGRLAGFVGPKSDISILREKMVTASFCKAFGQALAFDHKEDTSVGGGHDAQWATGVEDIIRDATRNIAPRTLFPFQRTSQSSGSFKVSHAQLVELVLSLLDDDEASTASEYLLTSSKEMASAPPSEDQRNQQVTSAEIFAGVCGAHFRRASNASSNAWANVFLTHLEDVMGKIPFALSGSYFDAIRYAIQFSPPDYFFPLTTWVVEKIESTLWQPAKAENEESKDVQAGNGSSHGAEGFTAQSKWLYLFSAVLIEVDEKDADATELPWYYAHLMASGTSIGTVSPGSTEGELEKTWQLVTNRLLPRLSLALGHPFDSCRDHISRCLFRICYCHRKRVRIGTLRGNTRMSSQSLTGAPAIQSNDDPASIVVAKLASLEKTEEWSFNDRYNALSTARRFVSYCVHLGEAKFEYSEYIIPLLPLIFEALKSTVENEIDDTSTQDQKAAKRALEADVIKSFRYMIAEISTTAIISYGRDDDISRVLDVIDKSYTHESWQVRHACANFLRGFQGAHKFLFATEHADKTMAIVTAMLADERREVSSAAMAALTGILAASPVKIVATRVKTHALKAGPCKMKKQKKGDNSQSEATEQEAEASLAKEQTRARNQQTSVFFLCASVMAQPYDTPSYVPVALAAISKHSFERNAPLGVRDTVKKCCADYKKTHMSDNWELHRSMFTQEQLESLEDVVSSPHYYA